MLLLMSQYMTVFILNSGSFILKLHITLEIRIIKLLSQSELGFYLWQSASKNSHRSMALFKKKITYLVL